MDAGAIYRFEYTARDPWVMGLGFAATRDLIAWLRHATAAEGNPLADIAAAPCERDAEAPASIPTAAFLQRRRLRRLAIGALPARFPLAGLQPRPCRAARVRRRDPVHPGRAADLHQLPLRRARPLLAPARGPRRPRLRLPLHLRHADRPGDRQDATASCSACTATGTCPKLFHIDTSAEFWQAGAALVGTGGTDRDVALPANVRAYMIAGGAHAPGMTAARLPLSRQSAQLHAGGARAAAGAWSTGPLGTRAARQPLAERRQGRTGASSTALRGPEVAAAGLDMAQSDQPPRRARTASPPGRCSCPRSMPTATTAPGIRLPRVAAPTGT